MSKATIFATIFVLSSLAAYGNIKPNEPGCTKSLLTYEIPNPNGGLELLKSEKTLELVQQFNHELRGGGDSYIGSQREQRNTYYRRLVELNQYELEYRVQYKGGQRFSLYRNKGHNVPLLVVGKSNTSPGQVILDPNTPPIGIDPEGWGKKGLLNIDSYSLSPSGNRVAIVLVTRDSDDKKAVIYDFTTKKFLSDSVPMTAGVNWLTEDSFSYQNYSKERSWYSSIHKLGQKTDQDTPAPKTNVLPLVNGFYVKDGWLKKAQPEDSEWISLDKTYNGTFRFRSSFGKKLIYSAKIDGQDRVLAINPRNHSPELWQDLTTSQLQPGESLGMVRKVKDSIFQAIMKDFTLDRLIVKNLVTGEESIVPNIPKQVSLMEFTAHPTLPIVEIAFDAFLVPRTRVAYSLENKNTTLISRAQIPFDFDKYVYNYYETTSKDGQMVPMMVVHKKGIQLDGSNPTLMYGYGGFKSSFSSSLRTRTLAIIEEGGVVVHVGLRGGTERGEVWHQQGKGLQKQNTFNDMHAATEYMIKNGYTSPNHLAVNGRSNGGYMAAAVAIQRPDLYALSIPGVGVLDQVRTESLDDRYNGWAYEYGTVDNIRYGANKVALSPLHNLDISVTYPTFYIVAGANDTRVHPSHSYKFAATLKDLTDKQKAVGKKTNPVLMRTPKNTGHGLWIGLNYRISEQADFLTVFFNETK